MKKICRTSATLLLLLCGGNQLQAQTHYGLGAGEKGLNHSFFGFHAGKVNTAQDNTFIGYLSGTSNGVGLANTFVGARSGALNIKGEKNTFIGMQAGMKNTAGNSNVFVGMEAGLNNLSGWANTYLGATAGHANVAGVNNTLIGFESGFSNAANNNTFLGHQSGYSNENGANNTFIGISAGFKNKAGAYNTFAGSNAGFSNAGGSENAFFGNSAGKENIGGNNNAYFGNWAGSNLKSGSNNTFLGYAAGGNDNLINATAVGALAKVTQSNSLVLGNNANVGIGVSSPTYQLHLSTSSAAKIGSSTWGVISDKRLKKDISEFTDGLQALKQINPVWFSYNGQAGIRETRKFVGVIAQEMQKVAPYTVGTFTYKDSLGNKTEYLDYDANAVTYIVINALKEQQAMIEQKNSEIQELSARLEKLEKLLSAAPVDFNKNTEANGVMLEQNAPNGFSQNTSIKYFIPKSVQKAVIDIYTVDGVKVESHSIAERGAGELKVSATKFQNGVLIYDLITDGKNAGAKKMIVSK